MISDVSAADTMVSSVEGLLNCCSLFGGFISSSLLIGLFSSIMITLSYTGFPENLK